jgi:hypothetical protein
MVKIQELQIQFDTQYKEWIPVCNATIQEIEKTIKKLKEYHRNTKIARAAGTSGAVAGVGTAIVGIALTPFTFGASVGLIVGGAVLAVAGGSTAAGATIANHFLQKNGIEHIQDQLDRVLQLHNTISQTAKDIKQEIDDAIQRCPDISACEFADVFEEVILQGVSRTSNIAVRVAELGAYGTMEKGAVALRVGSPAANGIVAAGTILHTTLLPINLAQIILSSFNIAKGSQTKAIDQLTDTVQQLKEQKKAIEYLCS